MIQHSDVARARLTTRSHPRIALLAAALMAVYALPSAQAFQIENDNPDISLRWDNTIKLGTIYRTKDADPALSDSFRQIPTGAPPPAPASFPFAQALDFNAGDQNFARSGFVSQRLDVLSEFDAVYKKNYGLRISAAGWYDSKYNQTSQAANDPTIGQFPYNAFPDSTRKQEGSKAELLDAFVFGSWDINGGQTLSLRAGRHALLYGESLFFGDNGIAKAQGPTDIDKLLSSPNAQFKEIIRPVPQLSAQVQLGHNMSLGGYYQLRWEADRLPAAGSYFSTTNIPWGSSQPEFVNFPASTGPIAGNYVLGAGPNVQPRNSGQFGLQFKFLAADTDFGLYFARFHDKNGQLYGQFDIPSKGGNWYFVFPEGINVVGASFSHTLDVFNFAGEISVRNNMPLRSQNMLYPNGAPQPVLAKGHTAHANFSWLASFSPNFIAQESTWLAEIAWNRVLSLNDPGNNLDAGRTRDATALRTVYSPVFRQVLPGLDLGVPIGLGYSLDGSSSITAWGTHGSGDLSIGIDATYLDNWRASLNYTRFLGSATPFLDYSPLLTGGAAIYGHGNPLADRNYISLNIRRTF